MPRFRAIVEYDGTDFLGFQRQAQGRTVQGELEAALGRIGWAGTAVLGAGRTDAGVHAAGQVAHVDIARPTVPDTVRDAVNQHLKPLPIAILAAEAVDESFDARMSAIQRAYRYRIVNRRAPLALEAGRAWQVMRPLDAAAMHAAAQHLVGHHDFSSFRAAECQAKSPVKTLDRLTVARAGEEIRVEASARSFLHHQVRSMVGSLALVGEGKWSADDIARALAARDRTACGPVAPPDGLYLVKVDY